MWMCVQPVEELTTFQMGIKEGFEKLLLAYCERNFLPNPDDHVIVFKDNIPLGYQTPQQASIFVLLWHDVSHEPPMFLCPPSAIAT
jgi:hypothetical protein